MKLTNPEKLTLIMLAELHEKLGIGEVDTKLLKRAIYTNNTWALAWDMGGIVDSAAETTPPEVHLVMEILDMWMFLEEAYERLDEDKKTALVAKTDQFGTHVAFSGFDGNNEPEYMGIASFLVNDMKRFTRFTGRNFNSHFPVIKAYRRMLEKFLKIRPQLDGRGLSVDELAEVLNARRHSIL